VNVQFIASMSLIAPDPPESRKLYVDALGLLAGISFAPWMHDEK
jgi:hypothetical protein